MSHNPPLVFAMTGAYGLEGGIASANRNVLRAFAEVAQLRERPLRVLSLLEGEEDRPASLSPSVVYEASKGDRRRFAQRLLVTLRAGGLAGFDHVTLALPVLPAASVGLVQTVIFTHGAEAWKRVRLASRASLRCATLCVANSEYTMRQMRSHLGAFRGRVCLLGLSGDFPSDAPRAVSIAMDAADGSRAELGGRVLLAVARFDSREREKGQDSLVRVLPTLLADCPEVQLVLAGGGDDRERIRALALELGVGARVFLPGSVPAAELARLYELCYAFALPSRQEGFGLVYVEAMSRGKACIGCHAQGAEDVIVDGETGFLIHSDGSELRDVLRRLLGDAVLSARLGQRGRERYLERFTATQHQRRVVDALLSVIG